MNKIALWNSVTVDDSAAEWAIMVSDVNSVHVDDCIAKLAITVSNLECPRRWFVAEWAVLSLNVLVMI